MWILTTVIFLLALSKKSMARRGTLVCNCSTVSDWDTMNLALINIDAEANLVIEAYKTLVERKATRHISRYKIDMFMLACDAQFVQARTKIEKHVLGKDRKNHPPCESIIKDAQKVINQMDKNVRLMTNEILEKFETIDQDYRQDVCADIENDISTKVAPVDRIILGAISGYRIEYEHLKSTFSLTIDKPISYQYLSLKFTSDILELFNLAESVLDTEITQWEELLSAYYKAAATHPTESRLARVLKRSPAQTDDSELSLKATFLDECHARASKDLFAPIRQRLTTRYRDELVFIPITIELRSFDHTHWEEYHAQIRQEFQDQFEGLNSDYLNNPNKEVERANYFERRTNQYALWNDFTPVYHQKIIEDLWNSKPNVYDIFIQHVNDLNDYALDEFATARFHRSASKH